MNFKLALKQNKRGEKNRIPILKALEAKQKQMVFRRDSKFRKSV